MIAGDFNLICRAEDKNNANYNRAMMGQFRRLIDDLALKDVPLHGRKFTWSNQQASPTLVRLDRVLSIVDWKEIYPNVLLQSVVSFDSDYCPLPLGLKDNKVGKRRFHFEAFWPTLEGFHGAVEQAWLAVQLGPCPSCPLLSLHLKFGGSSKSTTSVERQEGGARRIIASSSKRSFAPTRDRQGWSGVES
jgi:hypothetical protein